MMNTGRLESAGGGEGMTGDEKVLRSSLSSSGRSRTGVVRQGGAVAGLSIVAGYMAHNGEGKRRCSYKKATALICAINVVAAIYVLHGLLSPRYSQIPRSVPLARVPLRNGTAPLVMKYTKEEIQKIKEAHEARRAAEPVDLMRRVKEIEEESLKEVLKDKEAEVTKQKVAAELAQRLREMRGNTNQHQSEALNEWRKKKIEEARKREAEARGKEDTDADAKIEAQEEEVVAKTLELGWGPLLEAAGLTDTEDMLDEKIQDVSHERSQDTSNEKLQDISLAKPQGGKLVLKGPEIEDGIIPGRPVPPECNAEPHTDYDGAAVRWGLSHHTESAADCCQACLDQTKAAKEGELKCNIWVYCPAEEGCFSPDIYEHKNLECWLKQADSPKLNFKGRYSDEYRQAHPSCPRVVSWVSGVVS